MFRPTRSRSFMAEARPRCRVFSHAIYYTFDGEGVGFSEVCKGSVLEIARHQVVMIAWMDSAERSGQEIRQVSAKCGIT